MKFINWLLLCIGSSLLLSGCGGYNKLLKSDDVVAKYDKAFEYYYNKNYSRALALFSDVVGVNQGTVREDTIMFFSAKSLYEMWQYEEAVELLSGFMRNYTRSPFTEEAEYLYAMCYYRQSGNYERDQAASKYAIQAFNEYLNRYPKSIKRQDIHEMIEEMSRKLYQKEFNNAALYYKLGKYNAAIVALRQMIKDHPEIPFREEAMYLIGKSWFAYAENSVYGRQLDRYMKMMDAYYSYAGEFPEEHKNINELEIMYNKSKAFTEEHGYQAKAMSDQRDIDIEKRKQNIADLKDKRFYVKNKEEKLKITEEIKYERDQIIKEREILKENRKEHQFQLRQKKNRAKQEKKLEKVEQDTKTE